VQALEPLRHDIRADWLIRVRWGQAMAQVLIVAVSAWLSGGRVHPIPLLALASVTVASNAWLAWRLRAGRSVPPSLCGAALLLDAVQITAALYLAGGPSNPFSIFYLVLITVAAVTIGSRWTWGLAVIALSCYAALFALYVPSPAELHDHDGSRFAQHLRSMWLALTVAAGLTTFFVTRLSAVVEQRDREMQEVRERAARHERVAALTALAAGAAHELGTPLATMMVAAGELERALSLGGHSWPAGVSDDVRLIRTELERCREILDGMAAQAGDILGERFERLGVDQVVADAINLLREEESRRVEVVCEGSAPTILGPRRALGGAVANLVRNAVQAATDSGRVVVQISGNQAVGRLSVRDAGNGMPPDVLARTGDPFFSTRPPGEGRGLGLFLARSLAERLGGRLDLESAVGFGTTARLELPVAKSVVNLDEAAAEPRPVPVYR
jgi:two-component system, sensor histidine kinase RegB